MIAVCDYLDSAAEALCLDMVSRSCISLRLELVSARRIRSYNHKPGWGYSRVFSSSVFPLSVAVPCVGPAVGFDS